MKTSDVKKGEYVLYNKIFYYVYKVSRSKEEICLTEIDYKTFEPTWKHYEVVSFTESIEYLSKARAATILYK